MGKVRFFLSWVLIPIGLLSAEGASAQSLCEPVSKLASEFLDLELAGARWQGGDSPCLPKLKLSALKVQKLDLPADPALLEPEVLLPEGRRIEIQPKLLPSDLIAVRYQYIGKKEGKDTPMEDFLILKRNFNQELKKKGCVSLHQSPRYFLMSSRCKVE